MKSSFWQRHPQIIDALSVIGFILAVTVGTVLINTFVFRSYNVVGQSMENTLHDGERIIVNRLPSLGRTYKTLNIRHNVEI